jgi:hypothetical protein
MKKVHKSIKQVVAEKTNYSKSAKTHADIGDNEDATLKDRAKEKFLKVLSKVPDVKPAEYDKCSVLK